MSFYDAIEAALSSADRFAQTENGALGYRSSGSALLDLHYAVPSLRDAEEARIGEMFSKAWHEDRELALRWLFFLRDVRGGLGERRSFHAIMQWLCAHEPELVLHLVDAEANGENLISFYGRWDDVVRIFDYASESDSNAQACSAIVALIKKQLDADTLHMQQNKPVSLLAKWLPSTNTSSRKSRALGRTIARQLGWSESMYRRTLSALRRYIDVTETKMSANKWGEINYEAVPSKANLLYNSAFLHHDEERRSEYLRQLRKGEAKVNASVAYPYEIYARVDPYDVDGSGNAAYEAMWKTIVEKASIDKPMIVVADGSGSMMSSAGNTRFTALDVAGSLALYFAAVLKGEFADRFITFSEHPQLVDVSQPTLAQRKSECLCHTEVANTNIEAVFDLVLETAVRSGTAPEDVPDILIISDMEFDRCTEDNSGNHIADTSTLFGVVAKRYEEAGYKLPRLIFWNVNSRTNVVPLRENDNGIVLMSGFSIQNMDMIMSNEIDPYACLRETLMKPRYDPAEAVLQQKTA